MAEIKKSVLISIGSFLIVWGIISLIFIPTYCSCPLFNKVSENCWVPVIGMPYPLIYYFAQIVSVSIMRIAIILIGIYLIYKGIKR